MVGDRSCGSPPLMIKPHTQAIGPFQRVLPTAPNWYPQGRTAQPEVPNDLTILPLPQREQTRDLSPSDIATIIDIVTHRTSLLSE